ncbi:BnaA01g24350D [Brassica napus]|uniref:(rape) hypothetical protein n=1 Tax=Brassica napus TaxID=3708 RepID=A0A078HBP8_BRANA|nr:unnamed protein product [Brassica napus]CDY34218.1 BnaA01g24350D [Brassica napus]
MSYPLLPSLFGVSGFGGCQWRQLGFTFLSSAVLVCVRFSASSSSIRVPKREPTVSVDACLSHLGECLTELTSSYSLDGLANPS